MQLGAWGLFSGLEGNGLWAGVTGSLSPSQAGPPTPLLWAGWEPPPAPSSFKNGLWVSGIFVLQNLRLIFISSPVFSGINYDKPLPPIQVASLRAERIAKEKKVGDLGVQGSDHQAVEGPVLHLLSSCPAGVGRPAEGTAAACDSASATPAAATAPTAPAATTASAPAPSGRRQPAALGAAHRAAPGPGAASSTAYAAPTEGTPCDHYGGQCRRAGEQALPALKRLRFLQHPEQQAPFCRGDGCLLQGSCAGSAQRCRSLGVREDV